MLHVKDKHRQPCVHAHVKAEHAGAQHINDCADATETQVYENLGDVGVGPHELPCSEGIIKDRHHLKPWHAAGPGIVVKAYDRHASMTQELRSTVTVLSH